MIHWGSQKILSHFAPEELKHVRPKKPYMGQEITDDGCGYGIMNGSYDALRATVKAGYHYLYADGPCFMARKLDSVRVCWDALWFTEGPDIRRPVSEVGGVFEDWQQGGKGIIVAPLSTVWHKVVYGNDAVQWAEQTKAELRKHTDRPITIRWKGPVDRRQKSLNHALKGAWAVVTSGSTIGVEAVCRGVPVFTTQPCCASPMGLADLSMIETPVYPDREKWIENLAARTWNAQQFRSGEAWDVISQDYEALDHQEDRRDHAHSARVPGGGTAGAEGGEDRDHGAVQL